MGCMHNRPPAGNHATAAPSEDARLRTARAWAAKVLGQSNFDLSPVAQDASFRRYFRLRTYGNSMILMDAPPKFEDSAPFVDIASRLRQGGLNAPEIFHFDLEQGFGLLEDLGDVLYRDVLSPATADALFPDLFQVLARMAQQVNGSGLPKYDALRLQTELDLFVDWYLRRHRQRELSDGEMHLWRDLCVELTNSAAAQPQVFVHRDFHSSNLLCRPGGGPGIIDFQDAVRGPISYDFASLLWDRHITWPRPQLEQWMESYRALLALEVDPGVWRRWCDLMGLQRNLKIVGIFSRLNYRDGKAAYLQMIPRFYRFVLDVLPHYPQFSNFLELLEQPECAP